MDSPGSVFLIYRSTRRVGARERCSRKPECLEHEDKAAGVASHEVPQGFLSIRLRQGEEIQLVWFKATQQVDDFVSKFFAEELARGMKIRLIYMGMLLLPSRTMGEYGIEENGVIHSVITDAVPAPHPQAFFSWTSIVVLSLFSAVHISAAVSRITS
ncbi:unnamed protein product [Peronospora destructor]|uniref:Ubiquitin-like domain-containing protein n=1 Tax=Peronospora destructor TaxID=86335 RepID=A0AAV0TDM8_9STRA|nr:unnamed protein product [Peronospora destructor]